MQEKYYLTEFNALTDQYEQVEFTDKKTYDYCRRSKWNEEKQNAKYGKNNTPFCSLIGGKDDAYENFHEFIGDESNPEGVFEKSELLKRLYTALAALSETDRDLILSLVVYQIPIREMALRAGVQVNAIYKKKVRILKFMKKYFIF
jgi:DNA-directed RNA polymerase specialized sigma24 family protein